MIFPEGVLIGGALTGLGCVEGFLAQKGEVPITEADLPVFYIILFNLATRASGISATERSLEIAKLDQCHRRVRAAFVMPHLTRQEVHHLLAGFRIRAAWGGLAGYG